jgi:uncharacterized protein (DUF2062 family)
MAYRLHLVNETPQPDIALPSRTSWQRHVIDPIAAQLTQGITPEKIALTLAVGSALALFPILGTTTLLCLLAGIVLKLNQAIIQLVNMLCATIHFPIIVLLFRLGHLMFGVPYTHIGPGMMHHMLDTFWEDPTKFFERFGVDALHAIAAWFVILPFWLIIIYLVALPVLREALRRRIVIVSQTTQTTPPIHPVP